MYRHSSGEFKNTRWKSFTFIPILRQQKPRQFAVLKEKMGTEQRKHTSQQGIGLEAPQTTRRSVSSARPADGSAHRRRHLRRTSRKHKALISRVIKKALRSLWHATHSQENRWYAVSGHTPESLTQLGAISTTKWPGVHLPGGWQEAKRTQRNGPYHNNHS